jgi:ubiquinone biosynthesis protein
MREILKKKPADLDWIQKQGLLSVKLAQIFALRSDLIGVEKCRQLQQLYQHAASIPTEDVFANLESRAPEGFFDAFENIEKVPLAAASVGQVHRGKLKTGEEVVIKIIKNQNSRTFRRDVERMRRWLRIFLFFNRKLRRVGNPVALLNHVADYTTRELDLRNEIKGAEELEEIKHEISKNFPMDLLRFPKYWSELSNEDVLVSEFIEGDSLEDGIEEKSLSWDTLLQLFRINEGKFVFIDNGAICHAPSKVNLSLFQFFEHLSSNNFKEAFDSLLGLSDSPLTSNNLDNYYKEMDKIYDGFENQSVGEKSLTRIMMQTVQAAVEKAGADFGEEAFPIIRALMYLDGLVLRTHPDVKLIESMGPYLEEFRLGLNLDRKISELKV